MLRVIRSKKYIKKEWVWKLTLFYVLILFVPSMYGTHSGIYIIVHGTWGINSAWCKPGGEFYEELEATAQNFNKKVVTYLWPGYLHHNCRQMAAHGLATLIKSYPASMSITIFAHSHGGNVSILASQILGQEKANTHKIETLYTLATPICHTSYCPDMNVIKHVYNFFSFADYVQPVLGIFRRTLADHPNIANIRLIINGQEPGHLEFCTALAARWLPILSNLSRDNIGNFQHFNCSTPGIIFLYADQNPLYAIDSQRDALIDNDRLLTHELFSNIMRDRRDASRNIKALN